MKHIAILGGSFNPITFGHMQLAELVSNLPFLDNVFLVPNDTSVFGKNLETWEHRAEMVQMVVNHLNNIRAEFEGGNSYFQLCDIEHRKQLNGYTISLVNELKKEYPDCKFYYVIGMDIANNFRAYKFYDKLIKEETFILAPRAGYSLNDNIWFDSNKHISLDIFDELINTSSTYVRNEIENKRIWNLISKLPIDVIEYIVNKKLYQ